MVFTVLMRIKRNGLVTGRVGEYADRREKLTKAGGAAVSGVGAAQWQ